MKLSDVCTKGTSNIAQKDLDARNGAYPIYGASGFIKNVDFYHQEKPYIAIVKDGAGVGRVMQLPAKSSVIGTMQYIIPNEGVSVEYLAYALEHMNLSKYYLGAAIPHIYFKDYCSETLPNHTPEEQTNISHVLGLVSNLIFLRKQQLSKLDEIVRSRFIEMFENGNFPLVKAEDVCEFITKGTTPPTGEIYTEFGDNRIPYLKVYNLSFDGSLLFDCAPQYIDKSVHNGNLSRSKVYPNDVLMNIVGPPLGKFSLVTSAFAEWNINQAISIFRAKNNVLPRFLLSALMQPTVLEPFLKQAVGVRQLNISLEQCRNIQFPLPPIELQAEFVAFAEQTDKSKVTVQKSLEKLETLKKALMQQYFG
ncbi:MAG: restriction endonuclease subunit S [Clostridia bacterium]|nr:restriction endonuclease subunit S [Clostridia bacterium]